MEYIQKLFDLVLKLIEAIKGLVASLQGEESVTIIKEF